MGFRDATQNKALMIADLEAHYESLKRINLDLNREHT
jgi:hypothetical protein